LRSAGNLLRVTVSARTAGAAPTTRVRAYRIVRPG
jgi:hypothetical protein